MRRCGCASDSCSCAIVAGDTGTIQVTGAGSDRNPYVIESTILDIATGIDVQHNNANVIDDAHRLDFRGTGITVTPGTDEAIVTVTVPDAINGVIIPTGVVWMYGAETAPAGWLLCNGAEVLIVDQPNLYAVIGNNFGGNGTTTFKTPDMRDRFPVGQSVAKPIEGTPGGSVTKTIQVANLPPHTHSIAHNHGVVNTSSVTPGDYWVQENGNFNVSTTNGNAATAGGDTHRHTVDIPAYSGNSGNGSGTGSGLDIMPPWQAMGFIIKT